ncbi:MAG: hypothetical protein ACH346_05915, partial [Chthoniobacterales bacterium]
KLAQYAQPQNDFSTGSRTFQVCFAVLKIIFRPSPYANLLTPITVFRINGVSLHTEEMECLRKWCQAGEKLMASSVAWY